MSPTKTPSTPTGGAASDTKESTKQSSNDTKGPPSAVEFEPPLACVRRILKTSLPNSTNVGKDASAAFARASGIFIIYLTACANDFARENRRQTITANDVLAAIKELEFDEFTPELKTFLERYRDQEKKKKEARAKAKAEADDGDDEEEEHNKVATPQSMKSKDDAAGDVDQSMMDDGDQSDDEERDAEDQGDMEGEDEDIEDMEE